MKRGTAWWNTEIEQAVKEKIGENIQLKNMKTYFSVKPQKNMKNINLKEQA